MKLVISHDRRRSIRRQSDPNLCLWREHCHGQQHHQQRPALRGPVPSCLLTSVSSSEYNALGQVIQSTDRNGNVHQTTYDTAGRQISDTVTTWGANVDGSVQRLDTAYNNQGLVYLQTSYADTAGTQIVNQVETI